MASIPTQPLCALPTGPTPRVSGRGFGVGVGGCWVRGPTGVETPSPLYLGLVLVTDAVPALGLGNGRHTLGQQVVEVDGLTARVAGE